MYCLASIYKNIDLQRNFNHIPTVERLIPNASIWLAHLHNYDMIIVNVPIKKWNKAYFTLRRRERRIIERNCLYKA